jgi:hypothetical protein
MSRPEPSLEEREGMRRRTSTRVVLPLVAVSGLFVLVMSAATLQGLPQFAPPPQRGVDASADPVVVPETTASPAPPLEPPVDSLVLRILGIVFGAIVATAVIALVFVAARALIRYLRGRWRDRRLARRAGVAVPAPVDQVAAPEAEPDEAVIRRGVVDALRTVEERRDPGDGIVAAWVGLEESAADAGSGRASNETPAEFTVRIVGRRAGIADDVVTLLGLYERVRFGGMTADERDRAAAVACLRGIRDGWR